MTVWPDVDRLALWMCTCTIHVEGIFGFLDSVGFAMLCCAVCYRRLYIYTCSAQLRRHVKKHTSNIDETKIIQLNHLGQELYNLPICDYTIYTLSLLCPGLFVTFCHQYNASKGTALTVLRWSVAEDSAQLEMFPTLDNFEVKIVRICGSVGKCPIMFYPTHHWPY